MTEIRPYQGETALLILAFVQMNLDDNAVLTSWPQVEGYFKRQQLSTNWQIDVRQRFDEFQKKIEKTGFPELYGLWDDQTLIGYAYRPAADHFQTNDYLPDALQQKLRTMFLE